MTRTRWLLTWLTGILAVFATMAPLTPAAAAERMLEMTFIEVDDAAEVKKLAAMGIDIAAVRNLAKLKGKTATGKAFRVEAVVSAKDKKKLADRGFAWTAVTRQQTAKALGMTAQDAEETVYHSFDEETLGIRDQLTAVAEAYPEITSLETIGTSIQDRPILAMQLTGPKKRSHRHGGHQGNNPKHRPEVLIVATHHAREWVATQMGMRLIRHLTENYGSDDRVTDLLDTTRVWIIPVANPDGYQYTFDHERLWRKNLRDNDGDGTITIADGVDLNRNFDSHWGLDDEGSSPSVSDGTYRGSAPNSEPETQALVDFIDRHNFKMAISYHTYSDLILYPWGFQVQTPSYDDPIFVAQAGTDDNPAIYDNLLDMGYDPGVGADLYATNGDFTDWAYAVAGIPNHTVELTFGYDEADVETAEYYGFEFPDDEAMVQQVFEDNLPFALAVLESAKTPDNPVSPVGIAVEDVYHTPVAASYTDSQLIRITARNGRHPILLYALNGKGWRSARFTRMFGKYYNEGPGLYFTDYKATIPGQQEGDNVTYKIVSGRDKFGPYTYSVSGGTGGDVLIISAEDYTGEDVAYADPTQPNYLAYYTDALTAAGYTFDVWDVSAMAAAPSFITTLNGYKAAIWYTGDDWLPEVPDYTVQEEISLSLRDFINYSNGKLFVTGQDLAYLSAVGGYLNDDFYQYYLGAFIQVEGAGINADTGLPFDVVGESDDPVFGGLSFSITGGTGADNQAYPDSFLATSYFLPQYTADVAARYVRPGGPFEPHSGDYYVYSQMADQAFKRLGGTFTIAPAEENPTLSFWVSYDIETNWDYAFVEIRPAGTETWTTLPDTGGLTQQTTGDSCDSGWVEEIHPHLAHYMDASCNPSGSTGTWHAFTGNSGGWQQVEVDLSAYAGQTVELYISYATDWGTQNLGVFVDDVAVTGYTENDFETGLGDWTVSTTEGNLPFNNWIRMEGAGFPEGPAIRTDDSIYLGFGFEAIDTVENREAVMRRVMEYLLE